MKIIHRIAFTATKSQRKQLEALGLKNYSCAPLPGASLPFISFDIAENDPNWPRMKNLLSKWGVSEGMVRTEFSEKEKASSKWLEIGAWRHGYPQPREGEFGYQEATFDLTEFCKKCGIGMNQKSPFQMKSEPKWGRRGMMQLNWVFDEIFVTPTVWNSVFKPHGVDYRPVLNRKLQTLNGVVQLVIEEQVQINTSDLDSSTCPSCHRKKYIPNPRGYFPNILNEPASAMVKTVEFFGSGSSAWQCVLVNKDVFREINSQGIQGPAFKPTASVD